MSGYAVKRDLSAFYAVAESASVGADEFYSETVPMLVPPIPKAVTPYQARRALLAAGKLDDVEAAVAAGTDEVRLAWQFAASIERDSQFVASLAAAIGLSDSQVDDLFRNAVTYS